jgi:hypothetical protein
MPRPSSLLPGYTWEPATGRYRGVDGRFVARTRITDLLGDAINQNERQMLRNVTAYSEGGIDPRTWAITQSAMLKREYLQNAALGAGGWDRLTASDYGRIGGKLRAEYGRIANLAGQIAAGEVTLPQALNRVHMEQGGARSIFFATDRDHKPAPDVGIVRIQRRVLGEAEHCDDCVGFYEQGWQPEGALPVPGEGSICNGNCRCDLMEREVTQQAADMLIGTGAAHVGEVAEYNPYHDETGKFAPADGGGGGGPSDAGTVTAGIAGRREQIKGTSAAIQQHIGAVSAMSEEHLLSVRKDLAEKAGVTEEQLEAAAVALPDEPVFINVATQSKFLGDNLEQGGLPSYWHLENRPTYGRQAGYADMRKSAEETMGVSGMNPVYAYATRGEKPGINAAYGDVTVRIPLSAVRDRITITPEDSFVSHHRVMDAKALDRALRYEEAATNLKYPKDTAIHKEMRRTGRLSSYTEVQLFANDNGRFPFPEGTRIVFGASPSKKLAASVKGSGLKYRWAKKTSVSGATAKVTYETDEGDVTKELTLG